MPAFRLVCLLVIAFLASASLAVEAPSDAGPLRIALQQAQAKLDPDAPQLCEPLTALGMYWFARGVDLQEGDAAAACGRLPHVAVASWTVNNNVYYGDMPDETTLPRAQICFSTAEGYFTRVLAIREKEQAVGESMAVALNNLTAVDLEQGKYAAAETLLQRAGALEMRETPAFAALITNRALALLKRPISPQSGDYYPIQNDRRKEAERLFRQALAIMERTYGEDDAMTLPALRQLAVHYITDSQREKLTPRQQQILAIESTLHPDPCHPHRVEALFRLIVLTAARDSSGETQYTARAERMATTYLADAEQHTKPDDPGRILLYRKLAAFYYRKPDIAREYITRALALAEKTSGPSSAVMADCLMSRAWLYQVEHNEKDEKTTAERARSIREKLKDQDKRFAAVRADLRAVYFSRPGITGVAVRYAHLLELLDDEDARAAYGGEILQTMSPDRDFSVQMGAVKLPDLSSEERATYLRWCAALHDRLLGDKHPLFLERFRHSGIAGWGARGGFTGDAERCLPYLRRMLAIQESITGTESDELMSFLDCLEEACYQRDLFSEQEGYLRRLLAIWARKPKNETNSTLIFYQDHLTECCRLQGKLADEEAVYRQSFGPDPAKWTDPWRVGALARCCEAQGKLTEAETVFRMVLTIARSDPEHAGGSIAYYTRNLADFYLRHDRFAEARVCYEAILDQNKADISVMAAIARCAAQTGKQADIPPLATAAAAVIAKAQKPNSYYGALDTAFGIILHLAGKDADAEAAFKRAMTALEESRQDFRQERVECLEAYAAFLRVQQRVEEAEKLEKQAAELRASLAAKERKEHHIMRNAW